MNIKATLNQAAILASSIFATTACLDQQSQNHQVIEESIRSTADRIDSTIIITTETIDPLEEKSLSEKPFEESIELSIQHPGLPSTTLSSSKLFPADCKAGEVCEPYEVSADCVSYNDHEESKDVHPMHEEQAQRMCRKITIPSIVKLTKIRKPSEANTEDQEVQATPLEVQKQIRAGAVASKALNQLLKNTPTLNIIRSLMVEPLQILTSLVESENRQESFRKTEEDKIPSQNIVKSRVKILGSDTIFSVVEDRYNRNIFYIGPLQFSVEANVDEHWALYYSGIATMYLITQIFPDLSCSINPILTKEQQALYYAIQPIIYDKFARKIVYKYNKKTKKKEAVKVLLTKAELEDKARDMLSNQDIPSAAQTKFILEVKEEIEKQNILSKKELDQGFQDYNFVTFSILATVATHNQKAKTLADSLSESDKQLLTELQEAIKDLSIHQKILSTLIFSALHAKGTKQGKALLQNLLDKMKNLRQTSPKIDLTEAFTQSIEQIIDEQLNDDREVSEQYFLYTLASTLTTSKIINPALSKN